MFWIAAIVALLLLAPSIVAFGGAASAYEDVESGWDRLAKKRLVVLLGVAVTYLGAALCVAAFAAGLY